MKVAYILSMAKVGLPAWNFREIDTLTKNGVEIWAYPLKWMDGPYMPKPEWHFRRPGMLKTVAAQLPAFLSHPVRYLKLLALAVGTRTLMEFLLASDFSREMRSVGVEHIHCHFGDRKLFTGYYCHRILGVPLSVTVHAYEILQNPNPAMFKRAAEACEVIVVPSEFNKSELIRIFGVDEKKLRVIHLHGDVCDERMRKSVKILMAATYTEKKGHEVLFKALGKLDRDDLTVWLAGPGVESARSLAERTGVSHLIVFLGAVSGDLMNILYDACDMFVLPSRTASDGDREGLPVAIMEAMSHHKPVISTRHTGIPELVSDILVDENDVDGLAEAIARLADDPSLRTQLGERNSEVIKRDFSEAAVLELKDVLAGGPGRGRA